jgi:endonuclease YncB( thermonuclease family)
MEGATDMTMRRLPEHRRRLLSLAMFLIALGLVASSPPTPTLTGKVVDIADGDTLTLLVDKTQIKVRLEGIDTPERGQPFGRKAGQALARRCSARSSRSTTSARTGTGGRWVLSG